MPVKNVRIRKTYPNIEVGQGFHHWTVTDQAPAYIMPSTGSSVRQWRVRCVCGVEKVRNAAQLRSGQSKHCGCGAAASAVSVGYSVGKLIVLSDAKKDLAGRLRHRVRCSCGSEFDALRDSLSTGKTYACRVCRNPRSYEHMAAVGKSNRVHGATGTPEYRAWSSMKARCGRKTHRSYADYGGRGIRVADVWQNDFAAFLAHVGPRPSRQHSLDRLDNEKGYEPGNVKWRTSEAQNTNRRNTVFVEFGGGQIALVELCRLAGADYNRAHRRIFRFGWSVDAAITVTDGRLRTPIA